MRLALVHRLAFAVCLLALCSCARRDSEEVARLTKELEAAKAEAAAAKAAAAKAELALLKSPKQGDSVSDAGEKSSSDDKKGERPKADGKVYRTAGELLADMPKEAYPKFGAEGGKERAAARKWCGEKLVGRTVEWTATVTKVVDQGDGPFKVGVETDAKYIAFLVRWVMPFDQPVSLGGQSCQLFLGYFDFALFDRPDMYTCTADEVGRLRQLKGKKVTFRSTVQQVDVRDHKLSAEGVVPIVLTVTLPAAIDGFLPEADRPGAKK